MIIYIPQVHACQATIANLSWPLHCPCRRVPLANKSLTAGGFGFSGTRWDDVYNSIENFVIMGLISRRKSGVIGFFYLKKTYLPTRKALPSPVEVGTSIDFCNSKVANFSFCPLLVGLAFFLFFLGDVVAGVLGGVASGRAYTKRLRVVVITIWLGSQLMAVRRRDLPTLLSENDASYMSFSTWMVSAIGCREGNDSSVS